jgi:hypothetical protein
MTKRPKQRTAEISNLFEAVKFCSLLCKKEGTPNDTHILLRDNCACAFNGVLSCSVRIDEDLSAYPNATLLETALAKCGQHFSITQLDQKLSIKADKFKALIPCLPLDLAQTPFPDPAMASLDNRFSEALDKVSVLATEDAQNVILASVLMSGASLIATNRVVMLEAWHGIDLPTGIALPKSFCIALSKCGKKLTKFGFSQSSCTFYFEDESWLKTQFFAEPWPDVQGILNRKCNLFEVPNDFWNGCNSVAPFAVHNDIFFDKDMVRSHAIETDMGASYQVTGIPKGPIFNIKQLKLIQPYAQKIDFQAEGDCLMFVGDRIRGCIAGRS